MADQRGEIILVSSQVARGAVGNRGMAFALERLGFTVWAVPTVLMPYHPGHGRAERILPEDSAFARFTAALADGRLSKVAAVISGYLGSPAQAEAIARLVGAVKAARPDALYVCDPVIGDEGRVYVATEIACAVRDRLLPLADIATPNTFECAWLTGAPNGDSGDLDTVTAAARSLGPATVAVTSAPALMRGHMANLLVSGTETVLIEHRRVQSPAKGPGDVLAALFTARLLKGDGPAKAIATATASVLELVAQSARLASDELPLAEGQHAIVRPTALVNLRQLGASHP